MTENEPTADDSTHRPRTLREMSHTNPHTDRPFGETQTFGRGTVVAADGGERDAVPDGAAETDETAESSTETATPDATLGDVDHTPPGDTEGAHRTYERGHEGKTDVR